MLPLCFVPERFEEERINPNAWWCFTFPDEILKTVYRKRLRIYIYIPYFNVLSFQNTCILKSRFIGVKGIIQTEKINDVEGWFFIWTYLTAYRLRIQRPIKRLRSFFLLIKCLISKAIICHRCYIYLDIVISFVIINKSKCLNIQIVSKEPEIW